MSGSAELPHPQSPQSAASSCRQGYTWHTNGLFTYMQLHCYLQTPAHACLASVSEGSVCLWCEPALSPDPFNLTPGELQQYRELGEWRGEANGPLLLP